MIVIDLLKNHPQAIPRLANIWYEVLGSIWFPEVCAEEIARRLSERLNEDTIPLALVALNAGQPVGMCSLRENDGVRPDLVPWLGSLVVDPRSQKKGVGRSLIDTAKKKARNLGFEKLYLLAVDPTIPDYYTRLGWSTIGMDEFRGYPVIVMEIGL